MRRLLPAILLPLITGGLGGQTARSPVGKEVQPIIDYFGPPIPGPKVFGTGKPLRQVRQIRSASDVRVFGPVVLDIVKGVKASLVVTAQKELLPHVQTFITFHGAFVVRAGANLKTSQPIKIRYTTPYVDGLFGYEGATIRAEGFRAWKGRVVAFDSRIKVSGKSTSLDIMARSNSRIDLSALRANDAKVSAGQSSRIRIQVRGTLHAKTYGSARVRYIGQPQRVIKDVSGRSSVSHE